MRRTLSWIAKSAGYHVDASRHYQICQDEGTWVLTSNGSLVRHFSTLREAKRAAENQEATGDQGRVDWVQSRQCQGFPRNPGGFHPGSGLSPSLDQLGAIEREASFL